MEFIVWYTTTNGIGKHIQIFAESKDEAAEYMLDQDEECVIDKVEEID